VGSSKVIKTNVRIVAATNVDIPEAIAHGKFRQDLYYRLNTVPIQIPSLRDRKDDIYLIFRKFASDFAEKYRMPAIQLDADSQRLLAGFRWPGNIRQLKNITEQISIIEKERIIRSDTLAKYLPAGHHSDLPVLYKQEQEHTKDFSERDLLYKVLFDMKKDIVDLKKLVFGIISNDGISPEIQQDNEGIINKLTHDFKTLEKAEDEPMYHDLYDDSSATHIAHSEVIEDLLSLEKQEMDMIRRALDKHRGKRKNAAQELGISERTLYRKIKEYGIE
jgi:transcriptional regulator with PAS, ATPase and Fis domain